MAMASTSIKKAISSIFFDTTTTLGVLVLCLDNYEESCACEAALREFIVKDVSEDKRYKKRYLELFGLPEQYDFELDTVFSRLDLLGSHTFDFSFHAGSSTQKVLKVLLYDAIAQLEHTIQTLEQSQPDKPAIIEAIHHVLQVLHLCQYVFDRTIMRRMKERFDVLLDIFHKEDLETIGALVKTEQYHLMFLDLGYVLLDESLFFTTEDMPILFFVRKRMKKEKSKLLKKLKKSLYM